MFFAIHVVVQAICIAFIIRNTSAPILKLIIACTSSIPVMALLVAAAAYPAL